MEDLILPTGNNPKIIEKQRKRAKELAKKENCIVIIEEKKNYLHIKFYEQIKIELPP